MNGQQAPKQDAIIKHLRDRMLTGDLSPGDRLPTQAELTAHFEVSSVTVQRALDRLRSDGHVVPRGRRGTFVADLPPHLCAYSMVFATALHDPDLPGRAPHSRFMDVMAHAAVNLTRNSDRRFQFYTGIDRQIRDENFSQLAADLRAHRVGGLIFMSPNQSYSPDLLQGTGVPCIGNVGLEGHASLPGFYVDLDAFIERAVNRLAAHGRRRVGLVTISELGLDKIDHFLSCSARCGLQTSPLWMIGIDPLQPQWARNAMLMMLRGAPEERPDALVITDDHLVTCVSQGVLAAGIDVPGELDVVGHCSFPEPAASVLPITRLGFDIPRLLERCVQLLEDQRRGDSIPHVTRIAPVFAEERSNSTGLPSSSQGKESTGTKQVSHLTKRESMS